MQKLFYENNPLGLYHKFFMIVIISVTWKASVFVKASIKGLTVINALAYYTTEFITAGLTMTNALTHNTTEFITAGLTMTNALAYYTTKFISPAKKFMSNYSSNKTKLNFNLQRWFSGSILAAYSQRQGFECSH